MSEQDFTDYRIDSIEKVVADVIRFADSSNPVNQKNPVIIVDRGKRQETKTL